MPLDYQRVLRVMADAQAAGLTEEEAVDKVMEACAWVTRPGS